jgi:DNA repair ATPase RecN
VRKLRAEIEKGESKDEKKKAIESKWQKKYAELTVSCTNLKAKLNEYEDEISRIKEKNNKIKQLEDLTKGLANQLNNVIFICLKKIFSIKIWLLKLQMTITD